MPTSPYDISNSLARASDWAVLFSPEGKPDQASTDPISVLGSGIGRYLKVAQILVNLIGVGD